MVRTHFLTVFSHMPKNLPSSFSSWHFQRKRCANKRWIGLVPFGSLECSSSNALIRFHMSREVSGLTPCALLQLLACVAAWWFSHPLNIAVSRPSFIKSEAAKWLFMMYKTRSIYEVWRSQMRQSDSFYQTVAEQSCRSMLQTSLVAFVFDLVVVNVEARPVRGVQNYTKTYSRMIENRSSHFRWKWLWSCWRTMESTHERVQGYKRVWGW